MFPTTDLPEWGEQGTAGGTWGSFLRRYERPLVVYAQRRLGASRDTAEELAARFVAREFQREQAGERPVFRLFDPARGRFRSLLATSFYRFARDELSKDARRTGVSLESTADPELEDAFCTLVAREFFQVLRQRVAALAESETERTVLALKWPIDTEQDPRSNAEVARELGLTRGVVRSQVERIGRRFVVQLQELARQAGLLPGELLPFVEDVCRVLDRDATTSDA